MFCRKCRGLITYGASGMIEVIQDCTDCVLNLKGRSRSVKALKALMKVNT